MGSEQTPRKPRIRAPAIWRNRGCQCRQRMLLCFGLPLFPPSATLLGVAFGMNLSFGVFHILGLILTVVSVMCILLAIFITVYRKHVTARDPKKIGDVEETDLTTPRPRAASNSSQSSKNGVSLGRMVKIPSAGVGTEAEIKHRPKKSEKRKRRKQNRTKLPPVKEEDGRARFEKSMEERDRNRKKGHKRTKSESRKGFEELMSGESVPVKPTLTRQHLNLFNLLHNHQGSQDSLQMKRSLSMSDMADSASERLSVDHLESPRFSRRRDWEQSGSVTSRPVLLHTSSARTGVRASRFTSVL